MLDIYNQTNYNNKVQISQNLPCISNKCFQYQVLRNLDLDINHLWGINLLYMFYKQPSLFCWIISQESDILDEGYGRIVRNGVNHLYF